VTYTVAQRVKGILISNGHNDEKRSSDDPPLSPEELEQARRMYEEWGEIKRPKVLLSSGEYFTSKPDGAEAIVRYWGSVHREGERLMLYRLAVENCSLLVAEEDDPDHEGRKRLRVREV
jgi:hypothetical protein